MLLPAGETIGQPVVTRLEGFQLMWPDKPEGLDVVYGVTIEGGETTPMMTLVCIVEPVTWRAESLKPHLV